MQGIVIQGQTSYAKDMISIYKDIPNVVFSTWVGEDTKIIEDYGIEVIKSNPPDFAKSYSHLNHQTKSTYAGIRHLHSKGVTEALKIRGDLKPNNIKLLMKILKGRSLSFLSIINRIGYSRGRTIDGVFHPPHPHRFDPDLRRMLEGDEEYSYFLEYKHNGYDFPSDLIMYGSLNKLENCFNFQVTELTTVPPESLILYNFFKSSNLKFKLDYDHFIKNGISFFMGDCLKHNIKIDWFKHPNPDGEIGKPNSMLGFGDLIGYYTNKDWYDY